LNASLINFKYVSYFYYFFNDILSYGYVAALAVKFNGPGRRPQQTQGHHAQIVEQACQQGVHSQVWLGLFHVHDYSFESLEYYLIRRQRLKHCLSARKDEFELEEKCVTAVSDLCNDLRVAIDQVGDRVVV
jgi:hypothetical protein